MINRAIELYRRTGADVPFGNPLPSHGTEMEGWFWRVSDEATGRALIALCSVNRHPDGDWSTAAVAVHPGLVVRSGALAGATADRSPFAVTAGDESGSFTVGTDRVRFALGDLRLDLSLRHPITWPKAFGGGGVFSAIPFLNQYWHPYYLGGKASGAVEFGGERWTFENARLYAERNWGTGFPLRWWWGQAHDFGDDDVCVAFSGGLLSLGPIARDVNGVVVRVGGTVIRMTPPVLVRSTVGDSHWLIRGRSLRYESRWRATAITSRLTSFRFHYRASDETSTPTSNISAAGCDAPSEGMAACFSTGRPNWRASRLGPGPDSGAAVSATGPTVPARRCR